MGPGLSSCVDFVGGRVADRTHGKLQVGLSSPSDLAIRDVVELVDHLGAWVWLVSHEIGRVAFMPSVFQAAKGSRTVSTRSLLCGRAEIRTLVVMGLAGLKVLLAFQVHGVFELSEGFLDVTSSVSVRPTARCYQQGSMRSLALHKGLSRYLRTGQPRPVAPSSRR